MTQYLLSEKIENNAFSSNLGNRTWLGVSEEDAKMVARVTVI